MSVSLGHVTPVALCAHCGQPRPSDRDDVYCCRGCRAVATLLERSGLTRYYDLRAGAGVPVADLGAQPRDVKWLETIEARIEEGDAHVELDLQGVHCAACVWLVETLLERATPVGRVEVNPALGRCALDVPRGFDLRGFVASVEAFGYRFGPATSRETPASDRLLVRTGIALALAGNTMMLGAAIHLGLRDGPVYAWASRVSFATALLATAIGAPIFARSAFAGLRRGVLHLDLPIVLGMGLALVGSTWSYITGGGAVYTDTLAAFVALMLLGRWLQTRVLERNRRELLADPGAEGLLARVLRDGRAALVPCTDVGAGETLLVASGDLVPVASTLADDAAAFSLDFIDGESRPRSFVRGDVVPAGAFLADSTAARLVATEAFDASAITRLLRARPEEDMRTRAHAGLPKNVGALYVALVLALALATFVITWLRGLGLTAALEATTAALVVTCPCAFGIAVPLAYEVVQSRLRRAGIYVRRPTFFERALRVRHVVFDKTGTLTTGRLRVEDVAPLRALDTDAQRAAADLVARSSHPKSRALDEALRTMPDAKVSADAVVREVRGQGLELARDGHVYRLGTPSFTGAPDADGDLVLTRDGRLLAALRTVEELRPETPLELARLRAMGLEVSILSGDTRDNVARIAASVGVNAARAIGDARPEDKAAWIAAHDPAGILLLGDGLNDALALEIAGCSGTPSVERPFAAARADFYFVTPGLGPVAQTLRAAQRLANVVRADLVIALVYNVAAVALCMASLMKPWLAALLMPASSLFTIAYTVVRLTREDRA